MEKMKITHNEDYTTLTLQSDLIADWTGIDSVTLKSTINCGSTVYTDTILQADVDNTGLFTIDLTALFNNTDLLDGVYSFTIEVNKSDVITKDFACLFVDKLTKCKVAECVKSTRNVELQLDYYILSRASGCECQCDDLCIIYNRLNNELTCC